MNPNIMLVIILTVIAGFAIYGFHSGFFKTIVPIATIILTFWVVSVAMPLFYIYIKYDMKRFHIIEVLIDILAFAVTFMIIKFIIRFILKGLNIVTEVPVIHGLNKCVGLVFGIFEGLVIVWAVFYFVLLFIGRTRGASFFAALDMNPVLKWIYNNNLLMTFANSVVFK